MGNPAAKQGRTSIHGLRPCIVRSVRLRPGLAKVRAVCVAALRTRGCTPCAVLRLSLRPRRKGTSASRLHLSSEAKTEYCHPSSTDRFEGMYTFSVQVAEGRELTIVLDSTEPQEEYFSVDQVLVYEGEELIQTILPEDVPAVEDHAWDGLYVNQNSAVGEPDIRDLNFDGAEDFGLLAVSSYPHNVPYSYFLWNQETDRFAYGFTLCGSGALEIDLQNRQLIEEEHDVLGSYETVYAYAEDGSLQKQ